MGQVYKVDVQRNLVYLRGCVPGPQGGIVRVTDSRKASTCEQMESMYDLPVPTWLPVSTKRPPTLRCRPASIATLTPLRLHRRMTPQRKRRRRRMFRAKARERS